MNDVEKDGKIDQDEATDSAILGGISVDRKAELIEELADVFLKKILDDDRITGLKRFQHLDSTSRSGKVISKLEMQKNTEQILLLRDLVPENNKELEVGVRSKKWSKEYLQVIEILYDEMFFEYKGEFPFVAKDKDGRGKNYLKNIMYGKDNLKLLMRIEVFMLGVFYFPSKAFIFFGTSGQRVVEETPLQLMKRMTLLGKEFLFLWENKQDIKQIRFNYLSRNVKVLVDFFNELEPAFYEKTSFTIDQDLTLDALRHLDNFLLELKSFAESGRYKKNLPAKMLYKVRDGDEEQSGVIEKSNRIEMTKDWGRRSAQLEEAVEYFQKYKYENILLYRTQIRLFLDSGRVKAEEFQKIFGIFNKKAKRPQGLVGYSDFLYFWKEDFETQDLVLDLVSVFRAEALTQKNENEQTYHYINFHVELEKYFTQILEENTEIFNERKAECKIRPIPLLQSSSYEFAPELLIECGEKSKWKIFEKKVLPYFIFLEFFEMDYVDEIKSRFKRGQSNK